MKLLLPVLLFSSAFAWVPPNARSTRGVRLSLGATSMGNQITVVTDPPQADLDKLGVSDWPTWGCEVSKFPWTYDDKETCFLLAGRVTVTPDGGQPVTFGKGDLVTFPQGMSCVWDVHEAVSKHFKFGD